MDHIGIDVHKRDSQICILAEDGEVIERRCRTERTRLAELLGGRPSARIVIEASTESEWVAQCLESLGHEVVVADPNFASMYATRSRKVKTDRRDARTLAEACRLGAYRPAHRTSEAQRHIRARIGVRDALVRARTGFIAQVRALLRQRGLQVGTGTPERFGDRVKGMALPGRLLSEVAPLLAAIQQASQQIRFLDQILEELGRRDPTIRRLRTVPSIGPVTAAAFVATLDNDAKRFQKAHQVASYLGLVPREMSSGELERKGSITKAGSGRMRWLLVQAAISILRLRRLETAMLRAWAERIALRRGKKIAVVALARRLAGILYAMMRDGTTYRSTPIRPVATTANAMATTPNPVAAAI